MKTRIIFIIIASFWLGLNAQNVSVDIQKSDGNCLLNGSCEDNLLCFDLMVDVDEPNWELRSYNIWIAYPAPPLLSYNSDNSCVLQNGGDTDNNPNGQYRLGGINGAFSLLAGGQNIVHSFCLEYTDGNLILDSLIGVGGTAMVYGFPFESTLTMTNTVSGETLGLSISSVHTTSVQLDNKHILDGAGGWSGVSTWLVPGETDIEYIMSPVINDLELMYNLTEGIYSPGNNINTINNWNYKSGYIIKLSDAASLNICGSKPESRTINLMAGWNVVPVLSNENVPIESVFDAIGDNLVIAKQIAGYQVYYPEFGINSLSTLEPGKAYFVRVLETCVIEFPDQTVKQTTANQEYYFDLISPWKTIHKTPESHVFCFSADVLQKFHTGDLIGAFDQNGTCTGMMEVLDKQQAIVVSVFGDDQTTQTKDGMASSEPVSFAVFQSSTGMVFNLDLNYTEQSPNQGNFAGNGISIVKNALISATGIETANYLSGVQLRVFPNPTSGETNIKLEGDVHIDGKILISDSRGRLVYETDHLHHGGTSFQEFDFTNYTSGVYYLRLRSENYLNIQKIIVK